MYFFCPSFVLFVLLLRLVNSVLFVLQFCTFRFPGLTQHPLRARSGASPPRSRPNHDYQRGITHSGPYSQKKRGRMPREHPTSFCISVSPLVQRDRAKSCPSLETRRDFYRLVFFSAFDSIFEVLDPKLVNCRVIAKTFEVALYSPTLSCNLIAPALFL